MTDVECIYNCDKNVCFSAVHDQGLLMKNQKPYAELYKNIKNVYVEYDDEYMKKINDNKPLKKVTYNEHNGSENQLEVKYSKKITINFLDYDTNGMQINKKYSESIFTPEHSFRSKKENGKGIKKVDMYFRKNVELIDMLKSKKYYNEVSLDDIKVKNFNVTEHVSKNCKYYKLTPTNTPYAKNQICVSYFVNIKKQIEWYTSLDFYNHPRFIADMYRMYIDILNNSKKNGTIVFTNSLEVGSSPEVYHFNSYELDDTHFDDCEMLNPELYTLGNHYMRYMEKTNKYTHTYVICLSKANDDKYIQEEWNKLYGQNDDDKDNVDEDYEEDVLEKILYRLPYILKKVRIDEKEEHRYSAQLSFINKDVENMKHVFLFISFSRVKIDNIKLNEKMQMVQEYYDELYGDKTARVTYLPIGLFISKNKNFCEDMLNDNKINELNNSMNYHHKYDYFVEMYNKILTSNASMNYDDYDFSYNKKKCDDLYNVLMSDKAINVSCREIKNCNRMPILYKLKKIDNDNEINKIIQHHGRMFLGDGYYYVKIKKVDTLKNENNKNATNYFPHLYYCFQLKNKSYVYNLYTPAVRETFDTWIDIDQDAQRNDPNLLYYFSLSILEKVLYLRKKNMYVKSSNLCDYLIVDDKKIMRDINLNGKVLSIKNINDNHEFKIFNYGMEIIFSVTNDLIEDKSNSTLDKNIYDFYFNFMHDIKMKCVKLNINATLIHDVTEVLNEYKENKDINTIVDKIYDIFKFAYNPFLFRGNAYKLFMIIKSLPTKTYGSIDDIKKDIEIKGKHVIDEMKKITIKKDQSFINSNGLDISSKINFNDPHVYYETGDMRINTFWMAKCDDVYTDNNDRYISNALLVYMHNNSTSRMVILKSKTDLIFYEITEKTGLDDLIKVFTDIICTMYSLSDDMKEKFKCNTIYSSDYDMHIYPNMNDIEIIKMLNETTDYDIGKMYGEQHQGMAYLNFLQDLFYFSVIVINDSERRNFTCYIEIDGIREYVTTNILDFNKTCVIKLLPYGFFVFFDYASYIDYIKNYNFNENNLHYHMNNNILDENERIEAKKFEKANYILDFRDNIENIKKIIEDTYNNDNFHYGSITNIYNKLLFNKCIYNVHKNDTLDVINGFTKYYTLNEKYRAMHDKYIEDNENNTSGYINLTSFFDKLIKYNDDNNCIDKLKASYATNKNNYMRLLKISKK
jgi:hypothetical protein